MFLGVGMYIQCLHDLAMPVPSHLYVRFMRDACHLHLLHVVYADSQDTAELTKFRLSMLCG